MSILSHELAAELGGDDSSSVSTFPTIDAALLSATEDLISRDVVEDRSRGISSTNVEAMSLFESVGLRLLLQPRTVLYILLLARNALLSVINQESVAVQTLLDDVNDLANPSSQIDGQEILQQARISLLQVQASSVISSSSIILKKFEDSVSEFLSDHLASNVKKPGATTLIRPAMEAKTALPTDFQALKDLHTDLLDRLYALAVGLTNFLLAPLSTILTQTTISRIRVDIEKMLAGLDSSNARDAAYRLIAAKASLRTLRSAPSPTDPVVSSSLPSGCLLRMASPPTAAVVVGSTATGFTFPAAASLNLSTPTITRAASFPQTTSDLQNQGHLVSAQVTYPVTVPTGYFLFLTITKADGSTVSYKVLLTSSMSLVSVVAAINAAIGTDGTAAEYVAPGSSRIIIWANSPNLSLTVDSCFTDPNFGGPGIVGVVSNSAAKLFGFNPGQNSSVLGTTPLSTILDAFALYWGDVLVVGPGLTLTGSDTSIGTYLSIAGNASDTMSLTGMFKATSTVAKLYGTVNGISIDTINPTAFLEVGDRVTLLASVSTVTVLSDSDITLADTVPTFDEIPLVDSAVVLTWQALSASLNSFLPTWTSSGFQTDLTKIDRALAPLNASSDAAQRNTATSALSSLQVSLNNLVDAISAASMFLPDNAGVAEREATNGILTSFEERKFDRAIDLLLRGKVQETLALDQDTASFSGNFLKSSSDIAQTDFFKPNLSQDDGLQSQDLVARTP